MKSHQRHDIMDFPIAGYDLDTAKENDLEFILSCVKEDILLSINDDERKLSSTWIDDTLMLPKSGFVKRPMADEFFILRNDGKNIGMIWLAKSKDQFTMDDIGYVVGLFIVPEERNKGLGKALMGFAERWAENRGFVTLSLNVGAGNHNAVGFYEHIGYRTQSKVMRKHLK